MPMLSFRVTDSFVTVVDEHCGALPRAEFLRRAVAHYVQTLDDNSRVRARQPKPDPAPRRTPTPIRTVARRPLGHLPRCTCGVCKPVKAKR